MISYDYLFKLVLVGDSGVGKSCLLTRFAVSTAALASMPWSGTRTVSKLWRCGAAVARNRRTSIRTVTLARSGSTS